MHHEKSFADLVAMEIGLIGENMSLSRGAFVRGSDASVIGSFVHSSGEISRTLLTCTLVIHLDVVHEHHALL